MKNKSIHYNFLKIILTILVVLAHSSRMYTDVGIIKPLNQSIILCYLTNFIYSFHMPLFIAISGMVYSFCIDDLNKYHDTVLFIKNKIIRLLLPYIFFGLFYVAPIMVLYNFTSDSYIKYCFNGILLVNNSRHLWYLVVLFEIFLISILLKNIIIKKSKYTNIIIFLVLIISSFLAFKLPGIFQINNLCYYSLFFYLGILFNRYYEYFCKINKNVYFIIFMLLINIFLFKYSNWIINIIKALTGGLSIIGITFYIPEKIMKYDLVKKFNNNGFGIYLFHPMIIYILYYYLGKYNINPFILCFGITLLSYIISWLLTDILRKIHLFKLIGE